MMAVFRKKIFQAIFRRHACITLGSRQASTATSFKCDDIQVTTTTNPQPKPDPNTLLFGHHFSDHMLEVEWTSSGGWGKPTISPVHSLNLHPAAKVFHYAIELFEGMKAYRGTDNKVRLFRPMENMQRMQRTAIRCGLPDFDTKELLKCMKKLISLDSEWVPYSTTSTLYIRPTFIGTEPTLGVSRSNKALLYVLTGPVGPYYPTGFKPVTLLADPGQVRAWIGGCGNFKMGANYASTIKVQEDAATNHKCQQVLWLYGEDHQLTEVGTMNLFMYWTNEQGEEEVITAPLNGLILPGVVRKSLLEMMRQWGEFKVTEKSYTMKQVIHALKENRVKEIFGAGTACVVCPVEKILYNGETLEIPTMKGKLYDRLYKELTDIQYSRTPSPWMESVE